MTNTTARKPKNLQEELGKINPFEDPCEEVMLNLMRTMDQFQFDFKQLLSGKELSNSGYNVLRIVAARKDNGIPSQSISKDMVQRDPDITRLIDRLVKKGFVERRRCASDRRVVEVFITEKGKHILAKLKDPIRTLHQKHLGHMGDKKLGKLNKLLFEARNPSAQ